MTSAAHAVQLESLLADLRVDAQKGLSVSQVTDRLAKYGANDVKQGKQDSRIVVFFKQFQSPFVYLLLAASVVTFSLREFVDASVILFVVTLNAVIGFVQESKAKKTMDALRGILSPKAYVLRDSKTDVIDAKLVVVGDVILLQAGDKVPADARLIEAIDVRINEASLTGESMPVNKSVAILAEQSALADRNNMVFAGTLVVTGSCKAVVTAIGTDTEVGKIAQEVVQVIEQQTPLETKLAAFSKLLALAAFTIIGFVFVIGVIQNRGPVEMFKTVVGMAVSAIPEGLPIAVTVILSIGMWRMAKKAAIIRSLPAVQTLGSTTVICTDKTGTLTTGEMQVEQILYDNCIFDTKLAEKSLTFSQNGQPLSALHLHEVTELLTYGSLATTLHVGKEDDASDEVFGDPTEVALIQLATSYGIDMNTIHRQYPKLGELPFDQTNRYSIVFRNKDDKTMAFVKGAPETVFSLVSSMRQDGNTIPISASERAVLLDRVEKFAKRGLRTIAVAVDMDPPVPEKFGGGQMRYRPDNLLLWGIFGIGDPLREEAAPAIVKTRQAGMRVLMITGDHKATAEAIGRSVGLVTSRDQVVEAASLRMLSPQELGQRLQSITVVARAVPLDKLAIVEALKTMGEVVAMTGDGVNDAPSLKAADIGIAMGKTGTQVAIEASDMVLTDDNFSSIVSAIEGGRWIMANLRKLIFYLVSTSVGEVAIICISLLADLPLPLVATQIIFLNLITDGVCTVPLATEPQESNLMQQSPDKQSRPLFDPADIKRLLYLVSFMVIGSFSVYLWYLQQGIVYAQSMILLTMAAFQWFNALNSRSATTSVFTLGLLRNRPLAIGISCAILAVTAIIYIPALQNVFYTTALEISDWLLAVGVASSILWAEEVRKYIVRHQKSFVPQPFVPNFSLEW